MSRQGAPLGVVMPSLNQRPYLSRAVSSVIDGGLPEVQLIVSDGGSVDGTQLDLAALALAHPGRIQWMSGPDRGPADAVHRAIQRSDADVIGWLNSDDFYTEGALPLAVEHLRSHPHHVAVYGHGVLVDRAGQRIDRYPTKPPSTPLQAFAEGCFICQPTMFLRREAYFALGGLDTRLRTAFDFDLWVRLFKACPDRIGFLEHELAVSRVHEASITSRSRRLVAIEGAAVVSRHIGPAPAEWALTHVDELCAAHPFEAEPASPANSAAALIAEISPCLSAAALETCGRRVAQDRRLALGTPDLAVDVTPDGWAGPLMQVRVRQPSAPFASLRLRGRHQGPQAEGLRITVHGPSGIEQRFGPLGRGDFEIEWPLTDGRPGSSMVFTLQSQPPFVPARTEPGSLDERDLVWQVLAAQLS